MPNVILISHYFVVSPDVQQDHLDDELQVEAGSTEGHVQPESLAEQALDVAGPLVDLAREFLPEDEFVPPLDSGRD